jgi:hypothetical protein
MGFWLTEIKFYSVSLRFAARQPPPHRAKSVLVGDPGPAAQGELLPAFYGRTES